MRGFLRTLPRWAIYGLAVAAPVAALAFRHALVADVGPRPLLILFMVPIILSSLTGGLWPGLLSTAICAFGISCSVISSAGSLDVEASHDLIPLLIFILGAVLAN